MSKWKKRKKFNSRKEYKSISFVSSLASSTWKSQQIHHTMLFALAALPKFPTSTSISQSVYCLLLAYSPSCPCPPAKLPVQISELAGVLKWTPAACLLSIASFLKHSHRHSLGTTRANLMVILNRSHLGNRIEIHTSEQEKIEMGKKLKQIKRVSRQERRKEFCSLGVRW